MNHLIISVITTGRWIDNNWETIIVSNIGKLIYSDLNFNKGSIIANMIISAVFNSGLDDYEFVLVDVVSKEIPHASALFTPGIIYIKPGSSWEALIHELGHAYRDKTVGPIYNYCVMRDTDGNRISFDEAAEAMYQEEVKATEWANEQAEKYGGYKICKISPKKLKTFMIKQLKDLQRYNFTTANEVIDYFVSLTG